VAHEFSNLCEKAGVDGHTFYDLRRSFATIADNLSRDKDGVKAIMGHVPESEDMLDLYRQGFFDDRLRSVVDHVRSWLFSKTVKGGGAAKKKLAEVPAKPKVQRQQPQRETKRRATATSTDERCLLRIVG
jgi:hypothetical protein